MHPPIHFIRVGADYTTGNFLQLLPDALVGLQGLELTWSQECEHSFLCLRLKGLKAHSSDPDTSHCLAGNLRENMDKPFLNPQNTFTRDYQIPRTPLLSVCGITVGPLLCGQNRFNVVPPQSGNQLLSVVFFTGFPSAAERQNVLEINVWAGWKRKDVRTGGSASPNFFPKLTPHLDRAAFGSNYPGVQ